MVRNIIVTNYMMKYTNSPPVAYLFFIACLYHFVTHCPQVVTFLSISIHTNDTISLFTNSHFVTLGSEVVTMSPRVHRLSLCHPEFIGCHFVTQGSQIVMFSLHWSLFCYPVFTGHKFIIQWLNHFVTRVHRSSL